MSYYIAVLNIQYIQYILYCILFLLRRNHVLWWSQSGSHIGHRGIMTWPAGQYNRSSLQGLLTNNNLVIFMNGTCLIVHEYKTSTKKFAIYLCTVLYCSVVQVVIAISLCKVLLYQQGQLFLYVKYCCTSSDSYFSLYSTVVQVEIAIHLGTLYSTDVLVKYCCTCRDSYFSLDEYSIVVPVQ